MKEVVIKMLSEIFDNKMIITGTYALRMHIPVKEEDIHDVDILISNKEINKDKIKSFKKVFKYIGENLYSDSPSYHFEILGEKINIILKRPTDYENIEVYVGEDGILHQRPASILYTKAEYGREKDYKFFQDYRPYIKIIIKVDLNRRFRIQWN